MVIKAVNKTKNECFVINLKGDISLMYINTVTHKTNQFFFVYLIKAKR